MWYNLLKTKKEKLFVIIILLILSILISLIPNVYNLIKAFIKIHPIIYIFNLFLVLYYWWLSLNRKNNFITFIIIYSIFLIINLLIRNQSKENINTIFYLKDWLKLLFSNKIVFINVIGNILLFIPLGFIINTLLDNFFYTMFLSLFIILILELMQFMTKRGVFDLIDVLLNMIGIVIGLMIKRKELWMIKKNQES